MEAWQKLVCLEKVESTNTYFSNLLKESSAKEGTIIYSMVQTSGKGQGSNTWESEKGKNILLSLVLYPSFLPIDQHFSISKAVSLGIVDYLNAKTRDIKIKWPNDIYYQDKKLAGILIENVIKGSNINRSITGIGLNLNQTRFLSNAPNPVSLKQITGNDYTIEQEILQLRKCIHSWYEKLIQGNYREVNKEYLKNLYRYNTYHQYKSNDKIFTAKITGVKEYGYLQLETQNNKKLEFDFKEVEFII